MDIWLPGLVRTTLGLVFLLMVVVSMLAWRSSRRARPSHHSR